MGPIGFTVQQSVAMYSQHRRYLYTLFRCVTVDYIPHRGDRATQEV